MKLNYLKTKKAVVGRFFLLLFFTMFCSAKAVHAQNSNITGVVTGVDDGTPIPGVTVLKVGANIGTVTNFDGEYSIKAKIGDILQFSYLGMVTHSKTIVEPVLNVTMQSDYEDLEEVVVIGYGAVKKKEVTGAISSVKSEDLEQVVTSDLGTALQGQMAGVNVISSGEPGEPSEILIRGITTVSGDNIPLYVVDGLIQEGDPGISPNEVESIDVLKDAASTAIYGTRGAAGVILITTKQAKAGSLAVRVNSNYGIQKFRGEPTRLMNANQQTYFELLSKRRGNNGSQSDDEIDIIGLSPGKLQNDTNLYNHIVIDGQPTQDHSINISGGSKDLKYSVTTGFYKKQGTLINSSFERFNIRANTSYKHGKWNINATVSIKNEDKESSPGGLVTQILKYQPNRPDLITADPDEAFISPAGLDGTITGWVLESFQNTGSSNTVKNQTNLNVVYELFKGLSLSARYGVSTNTEFGRSFNPFREVIDSNGFSATPKGSSGVGNSSKRKLSKSFDALASYKFNLKKVHDFTITAGLTFEDYFSEGFSASRTGVLDNSIQVLSGTDPEGTTRIESDNQSSHKLQGMIARLQYNYKGKYILSSSVRRDASSRFAEKFRTNVFPSTALAWNISDENFWKPLKKIVNSAKIRASYGEVGNERFGDYTYDATITPNIDYSFGREGEGILVNGANQRGFANALVKWETSIQKNLGMDLGLYKNKLTLSFEYYNKTNKDMLFPIATPASSGGGGVTLNVGNMTNQGFEFSPKYRTSIGAVKLRMTGSFSTNKNKITKIIDGFNGFIYTNDSGLVRGATIQSQVTTLAVGHEAGAFFLYRTDGVVNNEAELIEYQKIVAGAELGDLIYVDTDGDGKITDNDREYRGSGLPEYEVGLNLNANYKGFDLSMNWYAALGHEIMNGSKAAAFGYGRHEDLVYQWSEANPNSQIPSYRGQIKDNDNYKGYTDLWLEDGDYLRLKQVTLGYSLSKSFLEKIGGGISKMRIYASAQNPLTITNYSGFGPEVGGRLASRGLDKGNYPKTSLYLIGLNLNF